MVEGTLRVGVASGNVYLGCVESKEAHYMTPTGARTLATLLVAAAEAADRAMPDLTK